MVMGFGNPAEWDRFNAEFPEFAARYDRLQAVRERVFIRGGMGDKADRIIFGLGRVCFEDFQQALILCGNGFGIGALQLLRGMYEREVTAAYLSKHQHDVDNFIDYHVVHTRKALNHLKETLGTLDEVYKLVSPEETDAIEREYQGVRIRFMEPLCKRCGSVKPMFSWTRHHTGVLAQRGSEGLKKMYFYWYYRPTLLSHSTVASLMARMRITDEGVLFYDGEAQKRYLKEALIGIHNLMLYVLDTQNEHFKLGLDDEFRVLSEDFNACWDKQANMEEAHAETASLSSAASAAEAYQLAGGRDISRLKEIIAEIYIEDCKRYNWDSEELKKYVDIWTIEAIETMNEAGILTDYLDMPPEEAKANLSAVLIRDY